MDVRSTAIEGGHIVLAGALATCSIWLLDIGKSHYPESMMIAAPIGITAVVSMFAASHVLNRLEEQDGDPA